jgi:hypothetical protein
MNGAPKKERRKGQRNEEEVGFIISSLLVAKKQGHWHNEVRKARQVFT